MYPIKVEPSLEKMGGHGVDTWLDYAACEQGGGNGSTCQIPLCLWWPISEIHISKIVQFYARTKKMHAYLCASILSWSNDANAWAFDIGHKHTTNPSSDLLCKPTQVQRPIILHTILSTTIRYVLPTPAESQIRQLEQLARTLTSFVIHLTSIKTKESMSNIP